MADSLFSPKAESDLLEVADYTQANLGDAQADRYLKQIEECCRRLAKSPLLGRQCDEVRSGLRRFEQGRHVVFYRQHGDGILVSRVLHQSMLPERHSMDIEPEY